MPEDDTTQRLAKDHVVRVFKYLQALHQHRNPVRRQVREQPWTLWIHDLPRHPAVAVGPPRLVSSSTAEGDTTSGGGATDSFILRVRRPDLTRAPSPPDGISQWLEPGWDDPFTEVRVRDELIESGGIKEGDLPRFEEDPARVTTLNEWKSRRNAWADSERPARDAMAVFERLYELRGRIEREAERVELVLGDGVLTWRLAEGGVHHPILLLRVQLEFDPAVPEFTILETDHGVELYSALFQAIREVDPRVVASFREELEEGDYHPLETLETTGFLRRLVQALSPRGRFEDREVDRFAETDEPRITRDPILFLRDRTLGFAAAFERVLEDLANQVDVPEPLSNVVGVEQKRTPDEADRVLPAADVGNTDEILFAKPWNEEQLGVARRLDSHGAVLVQGPPGTGKSHTIANLIGHFLAHGKSVLVTAHTTKALRVLREHVVPQLRPLCVSVLESDLESRKQLEESVASIVERLANADAGELDKEAERFEKERGLLNTRLRGLREQLINALAAEYRDIVIAGKAYPPAQAARAVAQGEDSQSWIPGPVVRFGDPLPLSPTELEELYSSNRLVTSEEEHELAQQLLAPDSLLKPEEFRALVQQRAALLGKDLSFREELWGSAPAVQSLNDLEGIATRLADAARHVLRSEPWLLSVYAAGQRGGPFRESWEELLSLVAQVETAAASAHEVTIRHAPNVVSDNLDDTKRVLGSILVYLQTGRTLNRLTLLLHPEWNRLVRDARVGSERPRTVEHFHALAVLVALQQLRRDLRTRWERQVTQLGGPASEDLGREPERGAAQYVPVIQRALDWYSGVWQPTLLPLTDSGFRWEAFLSTQPANLNPHGELIRLAQAAATELPPILASRLALQQFGETETRFKDLTQQLDDSSNLAPSSSVQRDLRKAALDLDVEAYATAYRALVRLYDLRATLRRRNDLLDRLSKIAPSWAKAIRDRRSVHGQDALPGDPERAWIWTQLDEELDRRSAVSIQEIQDQTTRLVADLFRVTVGLIDRRAWAAQVRRTSLQQRQALMGWLGLVRRIGRGYGRLVPKFRAEAARKMVEARDAVPVWIMPLSRVVENFDPRVTKFDVVIIDEASQSDAMALVTFYLGRQIIVVGDNEQVSPDAVGQNLDVVQKLIAEYLQGIPNALLYDGRRSIYDIALESFGSNIVLLEHFRCVPRIIQFSNWLSYSGRIRPLRDPAAVTLRPHVVPYRVAGTRSLEGVNPEEARTIASLIVAAIARPEYAGKTFGMVSLVGEAQALEVDKLLRHNLSPDVYEAHHILCGTPAQFQGDERDVVFLSLVDTPQERPLPTRQEDRFKQRFNVAASRARDQMWVVHSLDPARDLRPGDLRRRLIEYAQDPDAVGRMLRREEPRAQSDFEVSVMRRLAEAGYVVRAQWPVGYYHIDLVVEGGGRRLAVECDGDRFHPIEQLDDDLARQAILERLGWTFFRIRGSDFFREPDGAMRALVERLQLLGIVPDRQIEDVPTMSPAEDSFHSDLIREASVIRQLWDEQ